MKLVIEKHSGTIYAMTETNKHHKVVRKEREQLKLLPCDTLNNECDLDCMEDNSYIVFTIKESNK